MSSDAMAEAQHSLMGRFVIISVRSLSGRKRVPWDLLQGLWPDGQRLDRGGVLCFFGATDRYIRSYRQPEMVSEHGRGAFLARFGMPVFEGSSWQLYTRVQANGISEIDGVYALVAGNDKGVTICTDPLGVYPVYVSVGSCGVVVSDDPILAVGLSGNPLEMDRVAVLEQIITEGNLTGKGLLHHARRLRFDECIRIEKNAKILSSHRRVGMSLETPELSDVVERLVENLKTIDKLGHGTVCNLSGGYD